MVFAKKQALIAFSYLLIAASLGMILRLFPVTNVPATYKYIKHTHSHIALLGWVYITLTSLIYALFIEKIHQKKIKKVFFATHVTLLGMLFSFPFTGYAFFSILFSTLFLLCSYWFYFLFKKYTHLNKENYVYKFINTALLFMTISSVGPWALGIIMSTLGNTSSLYNNAIYFYLHFQYNGWFIFCLLGIFFYLLEKQNIKVKYSLMASFYKLMVASCVLTLFLSFLWTKPNSMIYYIAASGGILQLLAFIQFYKIIGSIKNQLVKKVSKNTLRLFKFIFVLFFTKIFLQLLTAIPYFAELAWQIKDFVIGYLHLIFLGIVTLSLLIFLKEFCLINVSKLWIKMYLLGFILSETLIIYKGFCNWQQLSIINNYYTLLVLVSALIPIGIIGIYSKNTKATFSTQQELL